MKDPLDLKIPGVYQIPCECGARYIGQTGRLISTRVTEHRHHLQLGQVGKSAVDQHCWSTGNRALFADSKIVYHSVDWHKCIIRESQKISLVHQPLNQEEGAHLSATWLLLHSLLMQEQKENYFDSSQMSGSEPQEAFETATCMHTIKMRSC